MNRITYFKRILTVLLLLVCLTNLIILPASAAGVDAHLKVYQSIKKNTHVPKEYETFSYTLTYLGSNEDDVPKEEYVCAFSMKMNDSHTLDFSFPHAGVYTYRLEQNIPKKKPDCVTYDKSVYTIRAYVTNVEDGLKVKFTLEDDEGDKVDKIKFINKYLVYSDIPGTGDRMNLPLYCGIMVFSASAIIILFALKRKKKNEEQIPEDEDADEPEEE